MQKPVNYFSSLPTYASASEIYKILKKFSLSTKIRLLSLALLKIIFVHFNKKKLLAPRK
uniref:Uncharacterized protein n=1 Tax=Meloidogyne enterolobii TaxID=390850 RepID=A0A6V7WA23_MELEN|nr:unnamed protein product [Meloidogyne enterolobii]